MWVVFEQDWQELKALLHEKTKEHDDHTAFSKGNMGLSMFTDAMISAYEHGRKHTCPPEWQQALTIVKARRTEEFQAYQRKKREVIHDEERFGHLETLDATELVGGPMRDFLTKKVKKIKGSE